MAMPSSGQLTFSALRTEFVDTNPVSLSEFYRGGSLVRNIVTNSAVPASGQISLSQFYGAAHRVFAYAGGAGAGSASGPSATVTFSGTTLYSGTVIVALIISTVGTPQTPSGFTSLSTSASYGYKLVRRTLGSTESNFSFTITNDSGFSGNICAAAVAVEKATYSALSSVSETSSASVSANAAGGSGGVELVFVANRVQTGTAAGPTSRTNYSAATAGSSGDQMYVEGSLPITTSSSISAGFGVSTGNGQRMALRVRLTETA